jgi:hypothetical protein
MVILGQPDSFLLFLRLALRGATRHGQQDLGVRGLSFEVGSGAELDRVEASLRAQDLMRYRRRPDPDEERARRLNRP